MTLCEQVEFPRPFTTGKAYDDEKKCSWKRSDLPAMVVQKSGRGNEYTYSASTPRAFVTKCVFQIVLYISHIHDESYKKDMEDVDFAGLCQFELIKFFACRQRLELNGQPLVDKAQILRDTDPHTDTTRGSVVKNRTVVFHMAVEYTNFAR